MQTEQFRDTNMSFRDYIIVVLDRKWIALLIIMLVVGASVYYAQTATPVYKSMAKLIKTDDASPYPGFGRMRQFYYTGTWSMMENLREMMKTRAVAQEVVKRLSEEWNIEISIYDVLAKVQLINPEETSLVYVTATSTDPQEASALANVTAEVFVEKTVEMRSLDTDRSIKQMEDQLELINQKLTDSERKLNKFREQEGVVIASDESGYGRASLLDQLGNLQTELSVAKSRKEMAQASLESVNSLIDEKKDNIAFNKEVDVVVGSVTSQIEQLQAKITEWQLELEGLREKFTEEHPSVIQLRDKIENTQARLQTEIAALVKEKSGSVNESGTLNPISEWQSLINQSVQLYVEVKGYEHREKLAEEKIEKFRKDHPDLLDKEFMLIKLQREARIQEQTLVSLTDRREETLIMKEAQAQEFNIVDRAFPPRQPVSPNKRRIISLGIVLGLMLGLSFTFLLEYLDDSVKRAEDVEKRLGLSIVGSVPRIQVSSSLLNLPENFENPGKDSPDDKSIEKRKLSRKYRKHLEVLQGRLIKNLGLKSPIAESYRSLWTNIQYANVDDPIRTALITSPGPGEGKSLTAANLAYTISQSGVKVLLVDADLRRPTVHRLFGCNRSPGLTELVAGDVKNIGDFVKNTYADNLYILPGGNPPPNPLGILGSDKMKQLIEEAKNRFDFILFDSPPVVAMADASVLAAAVDSTLLVLLAGKTKRNVAGQAKDLLQKLRVNILGVVLNNVDYSKRYGYYYYYYHYQSYYSREEKDEII